MFVIKLAAYINLSVPHAQGIKEWALIHHYIHRDNKYPALYIRVRVQHMKTKTKE